MIDRDKLLDHRFEILAILSGVVMLLLALSMWVRIYERHAAKDAEEQRVSAIQLQTAQDTVSALRFELRCSRAHRPYRIEAGQCKYPVYLNKQEFWAIDTDITSQGGYNVNNAPTSYGSTTQHRH
jgi:hypothetical protein